MATFQLSRHKLAASLLLSSMLIPCAAQAAPKVVASIAPVHSIVAAIMDGIAEPDLLISQSTSPHTTDMKPSQAKALQSADLVIWIGPELETTLVKPLKSLGKSGVSLPLIEAEGMTLLSFRTGENWEKHSHGTHDHGTHDDHDDEKEAHKDDHDGHDGHDHGKEEHKDDHDSHDHGDDEKHADHSDDHHEDGHENESLDNHIWLDPQNGIQMANAITKSLVALDNENSDAYEANKAVLITKIEKVMKDAAPVLQKHSGKAFITFHDAYHYFENRFSIEAAGSVMLQPGVKPGAARVRDIRNRLKTQDVHCLLSEPQFSSKIVSTLIEGTSTKVGEMDPIGASLTLGPNLYPELIAYNVQSLSRCLGEE